jgi:hypothetical protein
MIFLELNLICNFYSSLECEILMLLLKAQMDVQNWRFLSTLLNLHGANTRIAAWEKILQSREVSSVIGYHFIFMKFTIKLLNKQVFSADFEQNK